MDLIKQIEIKNRFISFATYYNEYSFLNWLYIRDISPIFIYLCLKELQTQTCLGDLFAEKHIF